MARRITPAEEIDRINERLFRQSKLQIQDRDSFDLAFNDLLSLNEPTLSTNQTKLRNTAFTGFLKEHPEVSKERLFTRARGKDLRRDRLKTAKKVVTTKEEFRKEGAAKVDLKGFDTVRQKVTKDIIRRRTFTVPSTVKGRVVFAKRVTVSIRGKRITRLRDSKGRFVSARIR